MKILFDLDLTLDEADDLIKNCADVNEKDCLDRTPLFYVTNIEIEKLFIQHNADINAKNIFGVTPIFYAKSVDITQFLIKNGADINVKNEDGLNRFYYVMDIDCIDVYIKYGADINSVDNEGHTVLHYYSREFDDLEPVLPQLLIDHVYRDLFTQEQQNVFGAFVSITSNDDDFFAMCLAYQEGIKNNVKIEIKEMEIL